MENQAQGVAQVMYITLRMYLRMVSCARGDVSRRLTFDQFFQVLLFSTEFCVDEVWIAYVDFFTHRGLTTASVGSLFL